MMPVSGYLPEEEHESLNKGAKVVVPRNLGSRVQVYVTEHLTTRSTDRGGPTADSEGKREEEEKNARGGKRKETAGQATGRRASLDLELVPTPTDLEGQTRYKCRTERSSDREKESVSRVSNGRNTCES